MTTISEIYELVNDFRANPLRYKSACVFDESSQPVHNLTVSSLLESAADWQATHQCNFVSHQTCYKYCPIFGSCSAPDRIRFFTNGKSINEFEVLVRGPRRPFQHLLNTRGHCEILRRTDINTMGGSIIGSLFIMTVAFLVS